MAKWFSVIGLVLTALGVLVGFYLPTFGAYFGWSEAMERKAFWRRIRTMTGVALVLVGTALQIGAALLQ